jgi:hypothetical protein
MQARMFPSVAFVLVILVSSNRGTSQSSAGCRTQSASDSGAALLSCSNSDSSGDAGALPLAALPASSPVMPTLRLFSSVGIDAYAGVGGIGFALASPLARRFNVRAGSEFFAYSTTFQDQGANVGIHLRVRSGHASLDWFPFAGRFRLSPLIVFANNNRAQATALVPAGDTITLNGQAYISSATDPLHGAGSVDFRKTSPGFTLGFGNIVPRTSSHFSFPIEAGFYYVGQPGLKVTFNGSACYPNEPEPRGCESVNENADFQQNLAAFIARNRNNLSYASFFPVFSFGFGYAFR